AGALDVSVDGAWESVGSPVLTGASGGPPASPSGSVTSLVTWSGAIRLDATSEAVLPVRSASTGALSPDTVPSSGVPASGPAATVSSGASGANTSEVGVIATSGSPPPSTTGAGCAATPNAAADPATTAAAVAATLVNPAVTTPATPIPAVVVATDAGAATAPVPAIHADPAQLEPPPAAAGRADSDGIPCPGQSAPAPMMSGMTERIRPLRPRSSALARAQSPHPRTWASTNCCSRGLNTPRTSRASRDAYGLHSRRAPATCSCKYSWRSPSRARAAS